MLKALRNTFSGIQLSRILPDQVPMIPSMIIPTKRAMYGANANPSIPKAMIFMPCCQDINAAWVATVVLLSLVDALIKGAIKGPVPPTNIVANDAMPPIPTNDKLDNFIDPIFGPHSE